MQGERVPWKRRFPQFRVIPVIRPYPRINLGDFGRYIWREWLSKHQKQLLLSVNRHSCSKHSIIPASTVTVSQPYANRWRNSSNYCWCNVTLLVAPTSTVCIVPTLPKPSANVAPTIRQRCPNYQPTLPNHPLTLPQPYFSMFPTFKKRTFVKLQSVFT